MFVWAIFHLNRLRHFGVAWGRTTSDFSEVYEENTAGPYDMLGQFSD